MYHGVKSIYNEKLRSLFHVETMEVDVFDDLIAHSGCRHKFLIAFQLGHQLSLQNEKDMTALTPVIHKVSRSVFHHADADIPHFKGMLVSSSGHARMYCGLNRSPVGSAEWNFLNYHIIISLSFIDALRLGASMQRYGSSP